MCVLTILFGDWALIILIDHVMWTNHQNALQAKRGCPSLLYTCIYIYIWLSQRILHNTTINGVDFFSSTCQINVQLSFNQTLCIYLLGCLSDHDQTFTSSCLGSLNLLQEVSLMNVQSFLRYGRIKITSLLSSLCGCLSDAVVTWPCDVMAVSHLLDMNV